MKSKVHLFRRFDGRIERTCEHGVGHTILSDGFDAYLGRELTASGWEIPETVNFVHGCDGCCDPLFHAEAMAEFFKQKVKLERKMKSSMVVL